jgi:hypothetical protein
VTRPNLLPIAALVLATGGAAANGGQQSELVVFAGGRLGAGVAWLDALLVLVAVAGGVGAGLAFRRRWPVLLLAAAPLDVVLLVAALDPPADLHLPLVVVATATRLVTLLGVLAGAQDVGLPALAGFAVGGYVVGGYLPGAHWLLAAGAVGGLLATAVHRPAAAQRPKPSPQPRAATSDPDGLTARPLQADTASHRATHRPTAHSPQPDTTSDPAAHRRRLAATARVPQPESASRPLPAQSLRSTVDRRPLVVGLLAALLPLLPLLLQGISPQETLGLVGFVFAAVAVVLTALFGWRPLGWLVATTLVVLGIGLPTALTWPFAVIGLVVGCALALLPFRAFVAAALCLVSAFADGYVPGVVFAALACLAAAALPALVRRSSAPVVFGPLLAVAVTAGAELILWASVTFAGQQGGVLFGDGHVTVPLLCAAAVLATALGIVDRRTINS